MADTKVGILYLDVTGIDSYSLIMAPEAKRREQVQHLYPDWQWVDGESVLWNWIAAVAHANGVTYDEARRVTQRAADPIWGDDYERVSKWVFYLA